MEPGIAQENVFEQVAVPVINVRLLSHLNILGGDWWI